MLFHHVVPLVRYADDFVILCKGSVDTPMQIVKTLLYKCDLQLIKKKTSVIDANHESFGFLGFTFQMRKSYRSGKFYPHVEPSKRSVERIKARVKELTDRRKTLVPLPVLVQEVNEALRG